MHHGVNVRGGDEPESADRDDQEPSDDAAFVAELGREKTGRERHEKLGSPLSQAVCVAADGAGSNSRPYFLGVKLWPLSATISKTSLLTTCCAGRPLRPRRRSM